MKKIFLLLTLTVISLQTFSAEYAKFHFGLKAAPSLAWLRSDSPGYTANGSKFGFSYGLITEFNFAKNYGFVTGIDVAYRGGKFKTLLNPNDTTIITSLDSYTLQYVEIPITLKFKTNEIGYFTYFLQAGVSPGINIRARKSFSTDTQLNGSNHIISKGDGLDVQEDINNFNLSMIIGGGIEYTLSGTTVLLVGVQFNNGFMDVFDGAPKVNSNYFALTLGILF